MRCAKFDVFEVFFGENVAAKVRIWEVEAFFAHDKSVIFDAEFDRGVADTLDHRRTDFAVKDVDRFADLDFVCEVVLDRKRCAPVVLFNCVVENDFIAFFDVEMVVFQGAEADFWPLDVLENGYRAVQFFARVPDPFDLIEALFV